MQSSSVALLNLGYFGIEFAVALGIGSVSLFADSIDFLEDTSLNLLILVALGWRVTKPRPARDGARRPAARAGARHTVDGLGKIPGAGAAGRRCRSRSPAGARSPSISTCRSILARYRHASGSLTRAAFLSARNDALANVAIVAAGLVTAATLSAWPDLIVGLASRR